MLGEITSRFLLGGAIVSAFSMIGGALKPPTFAGIFGAAPSVAIATLSLAFATEGQSYAAIESRSMMIGAVALIVYSAACAWTVSVRRMPVSIAAVFCWVTWLIVAFGLWLAIRTVGP
ncbi:MAG TPA: hypothetical protein VGR62_21520 [Candidatus Binatia bacterium]|nr:hypothetical protein [Candidatus Binatia bacterium]